MTRKFVRILVGLFTAFVALTAIGGGLAMLLGVDQFPHEWLNGTVFTDFTIPALVLMLVVGGSSLVAVYLIFTNRVLAPLVACVAGTLMMAFIVVEVLILKQTPPGPTLIEIFYFVIGLFTTGLAISGFDRPALRSTR